MLNEKARSHRRAFSLEMLHKRKRAALAARMIIANV